MKRSAAEAEKAASGSHEPTRNLLPPEVVKTQERIWEEFNRARRGRYGINEISAAAGIDRGSWFNYQAGRTSPTVSTLYKIAQKVDRCLTVRVGSPAEREPTQPGEASMSQHEEASEVVAIMMDKMTKEQRGQVLAYVQGMRAITLP